MNQEDTIRRIQEAIEPAIPNDPAAQLSAMLRQVSANAAQAEPGRRTTPAVSLVIAAFNESENVATIHSAISASLPHESFEIVFVDDGSTDDTAAHVKRIAASDPRVRLIRLARNFGVQAAYLAGMRAARGEAIVTLDCDLQHPPELIPQMLAAWRDGARIVAMVRESNQAAPLGRRAATRLFRWAITWLSDSPTTAETGDFLLLDRRALRRLLPLLSARPYWRAMLPWTGYPIQRLPFHAPARHSGQSSFNLPRLLRLAWDGVVTCSTRPLRLGLYAGMLTILILALYTAWTFVSWLKGGSVPGYPTTVVLLALIGSTQLMALGLLGDYIARMYDHSRHLPPYVILEEDEEADPE